MIKAPLPGCEVEVHEHVALSPIEHHGVVDAPGVGGAVLTPVADGKTL